MSEFYEDGDHLVEISFHALAISIADDYEPIILELLAKKEGVSSGKAGSMHLSVPNKNLMWTSAIVGTGVPVTFGIAELKKFCCSCSRRQRWVIEENKLNLNIMLSNANGIYTEDNGLAIHTRKEKEHLLRVIQI